MIVVKPHKPTPCEVPHFSKDGMPRTVPGQVYRHGQGSDVLCAMHGKARFGL